MIVVGIDPHKKTHTAVAVDGVTGQVTGEMTVASNEKGHGKLLTWARKLAQERVFAIEDCRHVSGRLERFLIGRGECVRRVPPKMMAGTRRSSRTRGKSDPIDATAVALAALREPKLPEACLAGPEREARLLSDHRDDLVDERKRAQTRLRWHLHDLELDLGIPPRALDRPKWLTRTEEALLALVPSVHARIALDLVHRCRALTADIKTLEREIARCMTVLGDELFEVPGCALLLAARIVGQAAGVARFSDEAAWAMHVGSAPLLASSGEKSRHRLNRQGNRRLNNAMHMIALTQIRTHPPARAYVHRKRAEGMSTREALRCLKRHIARAVFRALKRMERAQGEHLQHPELRVDPTPTATTA